MFLPFLGIFGEMDLQILKICGSIELQNIQFAQNASDSYFLCITICLSLFYLNI